MPAYAGHGLGRGVGFTAYGIDVTKQRRCLAERPDRHCSNREPGRATEDAGGKKLENGVLGRNLPENAAFSTRSPQSPRDHGVLHEIAANPTNSARIPRIHGKLRELAANCANPARIPRVHGNLREITANSTRSRRSARGHGNLREAPGKDNGMPFTGRGRAGLSSGRAVLFSLRPHFEFHHVCRTVVNDEALPARIVTWR